jgi:hypothetical protein
MRLATGAHRYGDGGVLAIVTAIVNFDRLLGVRCVFATEF